MAVAFRKAERVRRQLHLALIAPSGAGKTLTALRMAHALCPPGKRARVIDTENESASLYVGEDFGEGPLDYDVAVLHDSFHPDRYIEAIKAANADGECGVLIIDSGTHAWSGKDGVLEIKDKATMQRGVNDYTAWRFATPKHNDFVNAMVQAPCHLILCLRAKQQYELKKDEKTGRNTVEKIGMGAEQRQGMEYEFDVVCTLDMEHNLIVDKTRCRALDHYVQRNDGPQIASKLKAWLAAGAVPMQEVGEPPPPSEAQGEPLSPGVDVPAMEKPNGKAHANVQRAAEILGGTIEKPLTPGEVANNMIMDAKKPADLQAVLGYIAANKARIPEKELEFLRLHYAEFAQKLGVQ